MAMSMLQYCLLRDMFAQGVLPRGGALLELGEANWYGDLDPLELVPDIEKYVTDPKRREALIARLTETVERKQPMYTFEIVKVVYEMYFAPVNMQAVDFGGTAAAHRLDLNYPIQLDRRFQVVINQGTAEHIFDIGQVFRTMHDHTVAGGMMIHEGPFTGWIDHGFYSLQPTLFYDLAEANQYRLLVICIEDLAAFKIVQLDTREMVHELVEAKKLPANALLFTVLLKDAQERPFQVPLQGYYRKALSECGMAAWRELR